jgi:hypothetical protein
MSLIDPYLKTSRAKVHLENLRVRLEELGKEACEFIREDDVENQLHIVRMKVRPIPDDIPLIAGDLFYCLRASLDQLVWCLAKINATPGYPEHTQFPILEQRNDPGFKRHTRGVPPEAVKIIEALQPYNTLDPADVKNHLLWRLNKLCNIDKHIRIPIHGVTGSVKWNTFVPIPLPPDFQLTTFGDDHVMKIPLAFKDQMALNPSIPEFRVRFGDLYWKIECDFDGIVAIYDFVSGSVIPRFARFFH